MSALISVNCSGAQEAATSPGPATPATPSASPSAAPSFALVLVLDRSGSMTGQPLEMTKNAAIAAVDRLRPEDSLAVVAFDSQPTFAVPLGPLSKTSAIQNIRAIQAGGGTEFFSALDAAYQKLSITQARKKHVVLLTDGQAPTKGLHDLTKRMSAEGITVTAIGLGAAVDMDLLRAIASAGGGRNVQVDDPTKLPAVFAAEVDTARQ